MHPDTSVAVAIFAHYIVLLRSSSGLCYCGKSIRQSLRGLTIAQVIVTVPFAVKSETHTSTGEATIDEGRLNLCVPLGLELGHWLTDWSWDVG